MAMPSAFLHTIRTTSGRPLEFYCSLCKTKLRTKLPEASVAKEKAALQDEWDEHLHSAHPRQWEREQNEGSQTSPKSSRFRRHRESMSEMGIYQLLTKSISWVGSSAWPIYDLVEVPFLSQCGVLFMKPVLQPEPVAVNVKGDVAFRHTGVAVGEWPRELYCGHRYHPVRSDRDFMHRA